MKIKLLLAGLLATVSIQAQTGAEVFEAKCVACHMMNAPMDDAKLMAMDPAQRMKTKEKLMRDMKAPPMSKVSAKLKFDLKDDKKAVVAFIQDYIVNPNQEKSHCMPEAIKRFGMMPAIGKAMKKEEIDTVANWIYDNFSKKWDEKKPSCKAKKSKAKCAGGKCGGSSDINKP